MIEPLLLTSRGWTFRQLTAPAKPDRLLVLIHGWKGDEDSMWMLAHHLSGNYSILAPRGPYPVAEGGYSWRQIKLGTWGMATLEDFRPAAEALLSFLDDLGSSAGIEVSQFDLMGFSQGAAMGYTLTLLHPERIQRLVALSGFIPDNGEELLNPGQFFGKRIFISHGRKDDMIPVEQARHALTSLKRVGALVTYCESDGGHKVSKECLRAMEGFFQDL
jgi:phospholipase/carboxylesterase